MIDLMEKIGRFFAEQEAQIQERFSYVAYPPSSTSLSKPTPPIHRAPTGRGLFATTPRLTAHRPTSTNDRKGLSVKSCAKSTATTPSQRWQEGINEVLDAVRPYRISREVLLRKPPNPSSTPSQPKPLVLRGSFSSASSCPVNSRISSRKHEKQASQTSSSLHERQRKPRPVQQRRRKRKQKRSENRENKGPDPKAVAKANAEKIAAAVATAQERAKRFQLEKLQLERAQVYERQEAATRLKEQMVKIDAARAKSFRSSSAFSAARRWSSNSDSDDQIKVCTGIPSVLMEDTSSIFMTQFEDQLRAKMSLNMHVKQNYIIKYKQRDRISQKLDKMVQQEAAQSAKAAQLSAMKSSLEMELAAVFDNIGQNRQRRKDLEFANELKRLTRQREAERLVQIRSRKEEWRDMMKEDRLVVAVESRANASKRVEAQSANLRKSMQYESRHLSGNALSSARSSNNDSNKSKNDMLVPVRRALIKRLVLVKARHAFLGL